MSATERSGLVGGWVDGTTTWPAPWHTDPACAELYELGRALHTSPAADACELARAQRELNRDPCWGCSYAPILDELARRTTACGGGGYHALICDDRHLDGRPCWLCDVLVRYAQTRGTLAATRAGHVALLRKGTMGDDDPEATFGGDLAGYSTRGGPLAGLDEITWNVAAELLRGKTTLTQALQAASALLRPPTSKEAWEA